MRWFCAQFDDDSLRPSTVVVVLPTRVLVADKPRTKRRSAKHYMYNGWVAKQARHHNNINSSKNNIMGSSTDASFATTPAAAVITIHTTAPLEDSDVICRALPGFFVRDADHPPSGNDDGDGSSSSSSSVVLVDCEGKVAIFLLMVAAGKTSTPLSPSCAVWVVDDEKIRRAVASGEATSDAVNLMLVGEFTVGRLVLKSGSSILLVPGGLVGSTSGRGELVELVSTYSTTGSASGISQNGSLQGSRTRGSANPVEGRVKFPSLKVKLLGQMNGKSAACCDHSDFPLNSRTPVDIETELFKGKVLVILRPPNPEVDDPYWNERIFAKKKRRMIVQIQGKFKYQPQGVVYAGAEVSDQMKLGLLTKGLCGVLLRLVESFNTQVHYSYGDSAGDEKPHIVIPAYSFFERVVATPPGEQPPPIDVLFEESKASISERRRSDGTGIWNTTDTFSLSFFSMYIDLPTWQLTSLPLQGDISLKTFWGESLLNLCMYEKLGKQPEHYQNSNKYAFAIQMKFLGTDRSEAEESDDLVQWSGRRVSEVKAPQNKAVNFDRSESQLFPETEEIDSELFYDAEEDLDTVVEEDLVSSAIGPTQEPLLRVDYACPFWIDCIANRGNYVRAYAINWESQTSFRSLKDCEELVKTSIAGDIVDTNSSPRISAKEKLRRMVGCVFVHPQNANVDLQKLESFKQKQDKFRNRLLRRSEPVLVDRERTSLKWSGFVARSVSDRHWIEEWTTVTWRSINFYHPEKKRPSNRILLSDILQAWPLPNDLGPCLFTGYHVLVLETLGRSVYLMFASEGERNAVAVLVPRLKILNGDETTYSTSSNETNPFWPFDLDNPIDEFLHDSTQWNCKNRRILNCGKLFFRARESSSDPLVLVERSLHLAMRMTDNNDTPDAILEQRHAFLMSSADLKQANLHGLSEDERLTFFLNLYHVMIMHAFLVLGPPDSSLQWLSYFNNIAYEVNDDIFSLSELEHCIIRANMTYPSQFLSRFVIPKSQYHMALRKRDYRVNFALNCGSKSNPPKVILFEVGNLSAQLDMAARLYFENASSVKRGESGVVLFVPRVCQWFSADFGSSHEDLVRKVEPYLKGSDRQILSKYRRSSSHRIRFDMSSISVRYLPYNFECSRSLELLVTPVDGI